jgi:hypothetical protein
MKRITQFHQAFRLLGAFRRHGTREMPTIVGDNANYCTVYSREPNDLTMTVKRGNLEKRITVDNMANDFPHLERNTAITRHYIDQRLFGAVWVIVTINALRELPDILGHIAEELPHLCQRGLLRLCNVINDPASALSTSAGPPTMTWEVSFTITEK